MTEQLGDWDFVPESADCETSFSIAVLPVDLLTYWKRCGIMANFAASFLAFRQVGDADPILVETEEATFNMLSTILNELIENAAKYSPEESSHIFLEFQQFLDPDNDGKVVLQIDVSNHSNPENFDKLRAQVREMFETSDLEAMYFDRLNRNAEGENEGGSGLGLLMLLKDFKMRLGLRFDRDEQGSCSVTVRAYIREVDQVLTDESQP